MNWKTAISCVDNEGTELRGYKLQELMERSSFAEVVWLMLRGELPSSRELKIFEAVLISVIDHGIGTASTMAARIIVSGGVSITSAMAGGLLAIGDFHGGAVTNTAKMLEEGIRKNMPPRAIVSWYMKQKERVPGFGHAVLTLDTRATKLLHIARRYAPCHINTDYLEKLAGELNHGYAKNLPINIDGAIAAVLMDLGFDPLVGNCVFAIGRLSGLAAHVMEEQEREVHPRRLRLDEAVYDG